MGLPCLRLSSWKSRRATDATRGSASSRHLAISAMWPFTFIMSLSTRCASTVMACCRTPASESCSELPHCFRPYRCSVQGSTALGKRNARSPSATISAARVPLSVSSRSRVKMSARCSSQNVASIAISRESAASAAPRSNGCPVATAGCPHSATTTGA